MSLHSASAVHEIRPPAQMQDKQTQERRPLTHAAAAGTYGQIPLLPAKPTTTTTWQLLCCTMHAVLHPMLITRFEEAEGRGDRMGQGAMYYFQAIIPPFRPTQANPVRPSVCPVIGDPPRCAQARRETRRARDRSGGEWSLPHLVSSWVYPPALSHAHETGDTALSTSFARLQFARGKTVDFSRQGMTDGTLHSYA